jgi:hypothetical protein
MSAFRIPAEVRDLVINLMVQPRLRNRDEVDLACRWVKQVLTDTDAFDAHVGLLAEKYRAVFRRLTPPRNRVEGKPSPAPPANAGFRYFQLLPEDRVQEVLADGVCALTNSQQAQEELGALLLNPFALDDLVDRIHGELPAAWLEPLAEAGQALEVRYGIEPPAPPQFDREPVVELELAGALSGERQKGEPGKIAPLSPLARNAWQINFSSETEKTLARRIAEYAYGDPDQEFTLKLYALPNADGQEVAFELEMAPVPVRKDLDVSITFRGGRRRAFRLEVPEEVKAGAEPRPTTRSGPCEPIPVAGFTLTEGEWRTGTWPPELFARVEARRTAADSSLRIQHSSQTSFAESLLVPAVRHSCSQHLQGKCIHAMRHAVAEFTAVTSDVAGFMAQWMEVRYERFADGCANRR